MFFLVNEFYNYDELLNITTVKKHRLSNKYQPQYQVIANFTNKIPEYISLGDDPISITTIIPIKLFVDDILSSYQNNKQLYHQFIIDIKRSKLVINTKPVKSAISALNYLIYNYQDLATRLIACATQATCATSFEWLCQSLPENYHLSEQKEGTYKKALITINNRELVYIKGLRIFKLEDGSDQTVKEVLLIITIDDPIKNKGDVTIEFIIIPC